MDIVKEINQILLLEEINDYLSLEEETDYSIEDEYFNQLPICAQEMIKFIQKVKPTKGTWGYLQYVNEIDPKRKTWVNPQTGKKEPNPLKINPIYKHQTLKFQFFAIGAYKKLKLKQDPNYKPKRPSLGEKIKGHQYIEFKGNYVYLGIVPLDTGIQAEKRIQLYDAHGNKKDFNKDIKPYLPPYLLKTPPNKEYRTLRVDRIYRMKVNGNIWINPCYDMPKFLGYIPGT